MKRKVVWAVIMLALLFASFVIGRERGIKQAVRSVQEQSDTLYFYDTIRVSKPAKLGERVIGVSYVPVLDLRAIDSLAYLCDSLHWANCELEFRNDSLLMALEITQVYYHEDSLYDAWVSGWHPSLDSIKVTAPERLVVQRVLERTPMRWGMGVSAGLGVCSAGISPYVGVSVNYNFLSW